jgi:hypothetical protein
MDGGLYAQTVRLENNIGSHTFGNSGIIQRCGGPDGVGFCIEEPLSGQFSSVKALFPCLELPYSPASWRGSRGRRSISPD